MPRSVADQVVVVIGASSGIGRAAALAFGRRGARVVCAARNVDALDSLVEEITGAGGTAVSVPTDVAEPASVQKLAAAAEARYGRIDTWVNAAAVGVWGRVDEVTDEEFDRVMRVNFLGHVHGIHAVLPVLRRGGGGVIMGISSVEGVRAVPLHAPYTASKWALRALYDSLRVELAQEGAPIAVSTILPASIDTPFFEHARSKLGAMPKPPPPVYSPDVVAEAIVHAAEHPRREIPVGGAAVGFLLGQRFAPALTDALLSIPRLGRGTQTSDRPDDGRDNLDGPMVGTGRVHGAYPGRVLQRSTYTRVAAALPRPGELATEALARLRQWRPQTKGSDPAGDSSPAGDPSAAGESSAARESSAAGDSGAAGDPGQQRTGTADSSDSTINSTMDGIGGSDSMNGDDSSNGGSGTGGHARADNSTTVASAVADGDQVSEATSGSGIDTRTADDGTVVDALAVADLDATQRKLEGWGGVDGPDLSAEQAAGLQVQEEAVARGDFGAELSGDLGNAEVADEAADAPETVEPDTTLGPRRGAHVKGAGG